MKEIEIREVNTRKELKKFVDFPFQLYHGNAFWCPPLKSDEINTLRKDRNPVFDYCEARYWIAYQNGKPVGRIAGIINHHEVKYRNAKMVRFGWFDFTDDINVSRCLIETVKDWGKSKEMTGIHGPMGFTNMDPEGMLIEGYDEIAAMSTIYNFPYYVDHIQELGFRKASDWIQYEMKIPPEIPDKVDRIFKVVLQKYDLHLLSPRKAKEILPYATKMFSLYNTAFHDIYGFTPLTGRQIDYYTKMYLRIIRPEFVSLIIDAADDVVGFGITIPSLSRALQKANGSLFPFGFIHLYRALRKNDVITMYLIGVNPDYQGKGLLALIYHEVHKNCLKAGMTIARTHPQIEENMKALTIWKNYDPRLNIRRRCWVADI